MSHLKVRSSDWLDLMFYCTKMRGSEPRDAPCDNNCANRASSFSKQKQGMNIKGTKGIRHHHSNRKKRIDAVGEDHIKVETMVTQQQLNAYNQQQQQQQGQSQNDAHDALLDFMNTPSKSFDTTVTSNSVDDVRTTRKQRKTPSIKSASSTRSRTSSTLGSPPIDDPNFAPPPMVHISENVKTMYAMKAESEANYSIMPKYEKIRHSGYIMTRFSAVSLMTKKWRQNFWILYGNILFFFRSKEDFEEWLLNPYLTKQSRAALVKRFLNFKDSETKFFLVGKLSMKHYRNKGMMYVMLCMIMTLLYVMSLLRACIHNFFLNYSNLFAPKTID